MPLRDTDEYLSAHGDRMEQLRIQEDAYRAISRKNSFLEMMLARRYKKEQREAFKREIEEQRKLEAAETLKGKLVKSKETISTSESDSDMGGLKIASGGESGNENQPRSSKRIASDSEASRASRSRSRSRSKSGSRSRSSSRSRYASRSRSPSRSRSRSRSRSVSGSRPKMEDYISELIRWYQMVRE